MASDLEATVRLDDQLCFALYAATNAVTRAYRPFLSQLNLTYPQYLVMMVLWQEGEVPSRRIAERLKLGPSAVTPMADQLERAGLIARRRDESDRRLILVSATEKGRSLEAAAVVGRDALRCRAGLSDEALQELRASLHDLAGRMAEEEPASAQA